MYAKYTINANMVSGVTSTTINIPVEIGFQIVDNGELIERGFVNRAKEDSVNTILDYDKVRFLPAYDLNTPVEKLTYSIKFLNSNQETYYSDIGFNDADIKFRKNYFTQSYLSLAFYDSDNPLTQNFFTDMEIYNHLSVTDYYSETTRTQIAGQPKKANEIPVNLVILNPLRNRSGYFEGYHIYAYKDIFNESSLPVSLYMKATYNNAKTGKSTKLMTENVAYPIDQLIYKQYTKYDLYRGVNGYYYILDENYSNNITYNVSSNPTLRDLTINLYEIQTI